jgi:hypothetical protein
MFPVLSANTPSGAYTLSNSLRFRASAGAYLNKIYTSATQDTNNKIKTYSMWFKRGALGGTYTLLSNVLDGNNFWALIVTSDVLELYAVNSSSITLNLITTQVFRDPSSWYHIVVAVDTTQATASNRVKIYVNGSQITAFSTASYMAQNSTDAAFFAPASSSWTAKIGRLIPTTFDYYLDGYLTEINVIDGQALTPSSFGSTNATTGVWQPARYTGTYGTNGFYLKFSDIAQTVSSNVGLGKDFSGNTNYFVTNNISTTAGTTYDAMTDVPTLTSATVANYCMLNPLNTGLAPSQGNLTLTQGAASWVSAGSTIIQSTGKYYFESRMSTVSASNYIGIGLKIAGAVGIEYAGQNTGSYGGILASTTFSLYANGITGTSTSVTATTSTPIQIAVDFDAGKMWFGFNNTWIGGGSPASGTSPTYTFTANTPLQPIVSAYANDCYANFGQQPFSYTPPTNFVALNTYNLPTSTIVQGNKYMDATLYTGNLTGQSITNAAAFKPDLVWIKSRSAATDNKLTDSVRGATIALVSNSTAAETTDATGMTAFNANGFTVGVNTTYNNTAATYVGWQWQAGQGSSSSGTGTGGMSSVVQSVNTSAGFSVVTFTGNATNGTFTHGLGVAPKMLIIKNRTSAGSWGVWHISLSTPTTALLLLDSTAAQSNNATYWNSTVPTSSVVSMGTAWASGNYVAYCWAEIAGFNKFGSYVGNGSTDGPFVYTGFRPKWIMIKNSNIGSDWIILDTSRDSYNMEINYLIPDTAGAEASGASIQLDGLSNGFKIRGTWVGINTSGNTIIYAAFAENPFKNALAR